MTFSPPASSSRRTAPLSGPETRLEGLHAEGCDLSAYPGAAALVLADGAALEANGLAREIGAVIGPESRLRLHPDLVALLHAGGAAPVSFESRDEDQGARSIFDFSILPFRSGEAALVLGRDIAHETAVRASLIDSRRRFMDIVDLCGDFCWETDRDGRFAFVSPSGMAGFSPESLHGRPAADFFDPATPRTASSPFQAAGPVNAVDVWIRGQDGASVCLETSARPVFNSLGEPIATRGVCRDVTQERRWLRSVALSQERDRQIAHIVRAVRDEFDAGHMLSIAIRTTNRALGGDGGRLYRKDVAGEWLDAAGDGDWPFGEDFFEEALGRIESGVGRFVLEREHGDVLCVGTSWRHALNGAVMVWRSNEQGGWSETDEAFLDEIAVNLGVALQQLAHRSELEALSRTDALTGLLNRRAFEEELDRRLVRDGAGGALFYVDLDNFKPVNDLHGHQKGDEALVAVARMLSGCCRPGDLVARLGGDEFALWLERTDERGAEVRAAEMLTASKTLLAYSGAPDRPLGISIGIAVCPYGSQEPLDSVTRRADTAMYEIKHNGKAGFVVAPQGSDGETTGE